MRKILLSFLILGIVGLNGLHAQCIPNISLTHPGTYPDSATGLPHAKVGLAYADTIQIRVLTDTTVGGYNATVDSIVLNSVTGLPAGFNYACNPVSQSFKAGSNACILLTGTAPTPGMEGSHPLTINITGYGKLLGITPLSLPYTISYYNIHIDSAVVGIADLNNTKFDLSQNFPDPSNKVTDIYYNVPSAMMLEFKVYNLLGKTVYQKSFFAERGKGRITLDARDYAPGIYLYNLSNGKTTLTKRMVVSNN